MFVCLPDEDRVAQCNVETTEQLAITLEGMPWGCTATCCEIALFFCHGLHERTRTSLCFWEIPSKWNGERGAFHHSNASMLDLGVHGGSVDLWRTGTPADASSLDAFSDSA
jgi:hypothetical protein